MAPGVVPGAVHPFRGKRPACLLRYCPYVPEPVIEVRDGTSVGYGVMEYGVSAGYPKYKPVQNHPIF